MYYNFIDIIFKTGDSDEERIATVSAKRGKKAADSTKMRVVAQVHRPDEPSGKFFMYYHLSVVVKVILSLSVNT